MEKRKFINSKKEKSGMNFLIGIHPLMEAIEAGKEIDKVLLQKGLTGQPVRDLKSRLLALRVPIQEVPVEKINRISRKNHQGVLAFISEIEYASIDNIITTAFGKGRSPRLLILDRVSDVRNFGAIARTAEALGMDAIVIPMKGSAQVNEDAMKTSSGALNFLPVCREYNLQETLKFLRESGIRIVGCTEKASESLYRLDLTGPLALLFGSEEDGISPVLLRMADYLARIPMSGKVASLNVSVSVAIAVAEVFRQSHL